MYSIYIIITILSLTCLVQAKNDVHKLIDSTESRFNVDDDCVYLDTKNTGGGNGTRDNPFQSLQNAIDSKAPCIRVYPHSAFYATLDINVSHNVTLICYDTWSSDGICSGSTSVKWNIAPTFLLEAKKKTYFSFKFDGIFPWPSIKAADEKYKHYITVDTLIKYYPNLYDKYISIGRDCIKGSITLDTIQTQETTISYFNLDNCTGQSLQLRNPVINSGAFQIHGLVDLFITGGFISATPISMSGGSLIMNYTYIINNIRYSLDIRNYTKVNLFQVVFDENYSLQDTSVGKLLPGKNGITSIIACSFKTNYVYRNFTLQYYVPSIFLDPYNVNYTTIKNNKVEILPRCGAGNYAYFSLLNCKQCDIDYYTNLDNSTSCKKCDSSNRQYTLQTGSVSCSFCPDDSEFHPEATKGALKCLPPCGLLKVNSKTRGLCIYGSAWFYTFVGLGVTAYVIVVIIVVVVITRRAKRWREYKTLQ